MTHGLKWFPAWSGWNRHLMGLFWLKFCSNGSRRGWIRLWDWHFGAELFNVAAKLCLKQIHFVTLLERTTNLLAFLVQIFMLGDLVAARRQEGGIIFVGIIYRKQLSPRTYSRLDYVSPRVPNPRMTTLGILRENFRKNKGLLDAKKIRNKDLLVTKCMTWKIELKVSSNIFSKSISSVAVVSYYQFF